MTTWNDLLASNEYRVYRRGRWDYVVTGPGGVPVAVCRTRWGARRAIRVEQTHLEIPRTRPGFWEAPVVYTEPPDER